MNSLFVIIKPDALENKRVRQYIYHELSKFDLVIEKKVKRFTTSEVEQLWPGINESNVLNGLLKCYLTLKKSEILFLFGNITIDQLLLLKQKVRDKYAKGKFANCIHTPQDLHEYSMQYKILTCNNDLHDDEIDMVAINIWTILQKYGWDYTYTKGKNKKYRIYLVNDDYNGIDFVAKSICEIIRYYPIEICYILALQTEFHGKIFLYGCDDERQINSIESALRNRNIVVSSDYRF